MTEDKNQTGADHIPAGNSKDISKINVEVKEGQSWTRFLEIEIPADDVSKKFESVYNEYRNKAKISGFRPGKAPRDVVRKKFRDEAKADVFEALVGEAYQMALIQEKLWPIGNPQITDVEFEENKPLKFKAEIEIRPDVKLNKYKEFKLEKNIKVVSDEDVKKSLDYLREQNADFTLVERASQMGDLVIADLIKKFDKLNRLKEDKLENVEILLGDSGVLKEFSDNLVNMSIGEMKDVQIKYPDDYYDKNLAGDEVVYTVLIKEVKNRNLPEVNEEFVKKVSKYETVDELNDNLRESLGKQMQYDATRTLRSDVIKNVVEKNSFDVPVSLINRYLDNVVKDYKERGEEFDETQIKNQYRPMGENMIRWNFLFHEIAHAENIKVDKEDRKKWIHDFSVTHDMTPEHAREVLGKSNRLQEIDESILEGKVLEYIIENSEITENEK